MIARHLTPTERAARGAAARSALPREDQAELVLRSGRPDPVTLLEDQARTRIPELVPLRYQRMLVSPFTFYRGAAAVMASDLGAGPTTGLTVQTCGDAHLSNFGLFASPERRLLFDVNDFDETAPGPWEWDVKRLAASLSIAGRSNGFGRKDRRRIVLAAVRRYRDAMAQFAGMSTLAVWYARLEADELAHLRKLKLPKGGRSRLDKALSKARANESLKAVGKLTTVVDGDRRFVSDPPLVVPVSQLTGDRSPAEVEAEVRGLFEAYRQTLRADRRLLLDRFEYVDMARKVVGVGSVGTRCWIVLLRGRDVGDLLLLQVKEAQESVLSPHVPPSMRGGEEPPDNQGERVVVGQRLMQAASDIFLGWQRVVGLDGVSRDFYVRQLRDQKGGAKVERLEPVGLRWYAGVCGWTLARAHARSGDPVAIAAYLGDDDAVPAAMVTFAEDYADLNEQDHAALRAAVASGRVAAESP